jgi:hypothetical protein
LGSTGSMTGPVLVTLVCILLAQLDTSLNAHVLIIPFVPHVGLINALESEFAHYEDDFT